MMKVQKWWSKMNSRVKVINLVSLFYVLFAFWSLNPFFTWTSYVNGVFGYIGGIPIRSLFAFLASTIGIYYIGITHKKSKLSEMSGFVIMDAVIFLVICGGIASNLFDTTWISYIAIAVFLFLPEKAQATTYEMFFTVFAVTLIPSIIFYILSLVGLNLPYSVLLPYEDIKIKAGIYYQHRLFAVQLISPVAFLNRFNGIYYEAGILGTVSAILLGVKQYRFYEKGKWREKIVMVSGLLSMSVAFIILSIIYIIARNITTRKFRSVFVISSVVVVYLIFVSVPFNNPVLKNIQSRITIVDYSLQGDNRVSKSYEKAMKEYYDSDFEIRVLGFGKGAFGKIQQERGFDGSSYKSILYDYGLLGFAAYICWYLMYGVKARKKYRVKVELLFPMVTMQLANIYQNPALFPIYLVLVYSGGIAYLSLEDKDNAEKI